MSLAPVKLATLHRHALRLAMLVGAVSAGNVMFVIVLLLLFVSPTPFRDFSDPALADLNERGDGFTQITFAAAALASTALVLATRTALVLHLLRPVVIAALAWFALSAALSAYPDIALKRLVLGGIVVTLAAAALTMPESLQQMARMLACAVLLTLAASFFGILALPHVAIHSTQEIIEPQLAGLWRGVFQHKNVTSPMMVMFIFIGLFVASVTNAWLGWAIVALSAIMLAGAGGKTALGLCIPVLLVAHVCFQIENHPVVRGIVALSLLGLLNLFTLGSVLFEPIARLNESLLPDPTFTGRTEIWSFAAEAVSHRPLLGHGFATFWRTPDILSSENMSFEDASAFGQVPVWIKTVTHAHNGFMELALTTGLALAFGWIVVLPLVSLARVRLDGQERPLALLFFRIWLFGLCFASLEGVLFNRANPVWFLMLMAVFGLTLLSRRRLRI